MSPAPSQKPPSGLINTSRADLEICWLEREEEALILRSSGFHSMEICFRSYALEMRVKAIICKHLGMDLLPEACMIHDLSKLLIFSRFYQTLNDPIHQPVQESWSLLEKFSKKQLNEIRYQPRARLSDSVYRQLGPAFDDPKKGIHPWLSALP